MREWIEKIHCADKEKLDGIYTFVTENASKPEACFIRPVPWIRRNVSGLENARGLLAMHPAMIGKLNLNTYEMVFSAYLYLRSHLTGCTMQTSTAEARRNMKHIEIYYMLKHGSWLDMAEIEFNIMTQQSLFWRIETIVIHRRSFSRGN